MTEHRTEPRRDVREDETPETPTPKEPGWSNSAPHDGITSTEPPPGARSMREAGWSNDPVDAATTAPPPTVTALEPPIAVIGDPSFTVHVRGTGFVDGAVIVFGGQDEPTTFVSATEVTTGVNMSLWLGADPAVPVAVRNPDGAISNALPFAFTDPGRRH